MYKGNMSRFLRVVSVHVEGSLDIKKKPRNKEKVLLGDKDKEDTTKDADLLFRNNKGVSWWC